MNYRIVETGEIGRLIESPCHDPVIIEFGGGYRDAFHLRELEPTTHAISKPVRMRTARLGNSPGRRAEGVYPITINKMLKVFKFLETQTEPVYRKTIEEAVGFNCTRALMIQKSQSQLISLEGMGLVERIPGERTWVTWRLTDLGRSVGETNINNLRG